MRCVATRKLITLADLLLDLATRDGTVRVADLPITLFLVIFALAVGADCVVLGRLITVMFFAVGVPRTAASGVAGLLIAPMH